jgi:serine/threonine-protein kinase
MDLSGTIIGQYNIIEQIGRGGMSTVYKAHQPSLDRFVALKILPSDLAKAEDFKARFEREARAIARLRHRNILTIFDDGRHENIFYLVMEYVSGGTLQERLGWPQEMPWAINIISQVGDALAHAHQQGIIHRDVKPGNILMAWDDWPLLSDFGLAKIVEDSLHLTLGGAGLGTPQYMSPEQAQGLIVDHRSDIYSLGVVLYEAVTGRRPFGNDNAVAVIFKHINDPITPPRTLRSDIPADLETIILKALAKSLDDRYQRMEDFVADLRDVYTHSAEPKPHRGRKRKKEAKPKPSAALLMPSATMFKSRKRRTRRIRLMLTLGFLMIIGLTMILYKESMVPLVLALSEAVVTASNPAASAPSPTPTVTAPVSVVSSPSPTAPPSPTADAAPAEEFSSPTPTPLPSPTATAAPTPISSPTPLPPSIESQVWESDGAEMVFVPAGEFMMGSELLGDDERPVRQVYLDAFWIDRYEVTNERFARFVADSGYQTEAEQRGWGWVQIDADWEEVQGANWQHPGGPDSNVDDKQNHPVVLVSWNDADAYCRWAGKQLPGEAQWEKAARGPSLAEGYAWGEAFNASLTNTKESERASTTPVGSFSPQADSPYGVADMTGNVGEWVADWYDSAYYSQAPVANPPGPVTGTYKVLRGGSWLFDELYARTAFRYNMRPDYTYDFTGFRCVSR